MERDPSIDILRFLGLSLLILAHVDSPFSLHQVRMFDVPLMVFISGLSYSGKDIGNIGEFYWHRAKRLLIPVWTFIPLFLLPLWILQASNHLHAGITCGRFFGSFIFWGDLMGYIWIYKVFLIVMLFTPLLVGINKTVKNDCFYFLIIISIITVQQVLCMWWGRDPGMPFQSILSTYGLYILGYLPMYMLGLRFRNCNRVTEVRWLTFVGFIFILCFVWYLYKKGLPINLDTYKYPPQAYYMIYGCFVSLILWFFKIPITKLFNNKYFIYIGQNCDWIYLWHAFFVFYVTYVVKQWYLQYVIIYSLALIICVLQKKIVAKSKVGFVKKYY